MNPFITPRPQPWNLPTTIAQHWCAFDTNNYRDNLYPSLGILLPYSLNGAVAKRRAEFLAGRYCAHNALTELSHAKSGNKNGSVGIGPQGNPLWPSGVKGSISHSRALACALVSSDPAVEGIGTDIENIVSKDTLEQSLDLILVRKERPLLDFDDFDARTTFTLLFSLKESFFKAAYPMVGHYFDFDAVTVSHIDTRTQTIAFQLNFILHDHLPENASFQAHYRFLDEHTLATLVLLPTPLNLFHSPR